ncbi:hypothetical protein VitviT2T_006619 [Vitis vinifera]|uniref:Uncharacterized protein n=1 Tax=Vitis vinifera TaxID=29760 RepID=A0ABY9BXJ3_VITVI|nr:hypothetical protein VitviT2T_006619 [Vitis vinifera]
MNLGQRQGKAVGSNSSSFEASAPTFGGQGLDKLSRPYGKLRLKWDGQDGFWGLGERNQDPWLPERKMKASPCEYGAPWVLGMSYGQSMGM